MSHRPTDRHILDLDGDPTPGDPQRVRKVAGTLHDFADDVADARRPEGVAKEADQVVLISGAGPVLDPADAFHDIFDAVTSTFRFV